MTPVWLLLAAVCVACAPRAPALPQQGSAPVVAADTCAQRRPDAPAFITRVVPDSVNVAAARMEPVLLELHGCGFEPSGNDVMFGPERLRGLTSSDGGTRLRFPMPHEIRGGDEVPPMPIQPGSYDVAVTTRRGRSNTRSVTLY